METKGEALILLWGQLVPSVAKANLTDRSVSHWAFSGEGSVPRGVSLASNHLSVGFTRLCPVYNRNIIMSPTSIDLFTVHLDSSSQMISTGETLAK